MFEVTFSGLLEKPERIEANYYRLDGTNSWFVFYQMPEPSLVTLKSGEKMEELPALEVARIQAQFVQMIKRLEAVPA